MSIAVSKDVQEQGVPPWPETGPPARIRQHLPELAWGIFAVVNLLVMLRLDAWQTVPFHLIWLSLSILYGFRMWGVRSTAATLVVVMAVTGYALIHPVLVRHDGLSGLDESTEIPLMAAIFVTMVWHARRRQVALGETERALDRERDAVERLRVAGELKNTFLQAVSHDIRTPLTVIVAGAITLQRREETGMSHAEASDLAGRLAVNAQKLKRLVTDLLDMDRLNRGIVEPNLCPADIGALVRSVAEETEAWAQGRLRIDTERVVVPVDAAKVERMVENLLVNAVLHTPSGSTIWIRVEREHAGALIVVEDDGEGVPSGLHDSIFEPFIQGTDESNPSPGMGIGLSLVARFAQLHRGRAWVEDRPGGGASFRVYLPDAASNDSLGGLHLTATQ